MRPPTATRPDVGLMIPESRRSSVVLPEPLRPTRPTALPGSTVNDTSRSAHDVGAAHAAARDDQILQRAVLARIDAEAARGVLDDDLSGPHARDGTPSARRAIPASVRTNAGSAFGISIRSTPHPELGRALLRLDVDVPADLEMVGDEADRADEHVVDAVLRAARRDGRGCPARATARRSATRSGTRSSTGRRGLRPRRRGATSRAAGPCTGRPSRGCAPGSECAVKTTCASRAAHAVGEQLDEARLVVPALDERELGAARERLLELVAVALDRERRVVRREHEPDDALGAAGERRLRGVGDARRPVLHPRVAPAARAPPRAPRASAR